MNTNILSILLEKDGLSFLITKDNELIEQGYNAFESKVNVLENLNKVFEKNIYLKQSYNKVQVAILSANFILVPAEHYTEDPEDEKWLGFNAEITESDVLLSHKVLKHNLVFISLISAEINDFFKNKLKATNMVHAGELFLNQFEVTEPAEQVFLNIHHKQFEMAVLKNEKLHLYNIFDYEAKEDIMYHLLNTLKVLNIDTNTVELYYYGLTNQPDTLKMMMNFVRHVIPATSDIQRMEHLTLIENLQQDL
ncbi:MAG: DUF3822 family protein [Weeksellaceae bacterium]